MCIAAGCDYLKNIRGIGVKRAKDIVSQEGFREKMRQLQHAPPDYIADFSRAEFIFLHQTVFNVTENCVMPLHPITSDNFSNGDLEACGQYPFVTCDWACIHPQSQGQCSCPSRVVEGYNNPLLVLV